MNDPQIFSEDELVPISALQHLIFCERQWALIHLEQIWEENRLTAEGRQLHEKVDLPQSELRGSVRVVRALRLRSLKYGLTGIADVVEFYQTADRVAWIPYPIEYKRGKPKKSLADIVQLCAQALCLEEMLGVSVPAGAMFYGEPKRRLALEFSSDLRTNTVQYIKRLHEIASAKKTPPAVFEKKCTNCSLIDWCIPACTNGSKSAIQYMKRMVNWITEDK